MHTATTAETPPENPHPPPVPPHRRRILTATLVAAAAAGLLAYGLTRGDDDPAPPERHTPTTPVTYTVHGTGTAHLTYLGNNPKGTTVLPDAELPWTTTVDVPRSKNATLTVVLPANGTNATCTLTINGHHRQRATATGPHGRATCTTELDRQADRSAQR
ncbi:MmpS family transport accessory protein [Streptomyces synnematoformans]|uniref:MmpS family membrane protein n=1 Tax=Streptomyces synnematoformans TaxID=415721 RepID=A0ABN2Y317_9ACTN